MRGDEPGRNALKPVSRLLLTGWSVVRIHPGEPSNKRYLEANTHFIDSPKDTFGNALGNILHGWLPWTRKPYTDNSGDLSRPFLISQDTTLRPQIN